MAVTERNVAFDCPECQSRIAFQGQSWQCPDCGFAPNHSAD